jgi:hypothetical protein
LPVYMLMCSVLTALILRAIRATGRFDSRNLRRLLRCVLHFTADGTQGAGRPLGVRVRPVLSVADAGWAGWAGWLAAASFRAVIAAMVWFGCDCCNGLVWL